MRCMGTDLEEALFGAERKPRNRPHHVGKPLPSEGRHDLDGPLLKRNDQSGVWPCLVPACGIEATHAVLVGSSRAHPLVKQSQ